MSFFFLKKKKEPPTMTILDFKTVQTECSELKNVQIEQCGSGAIRRLVKAQIGRIYEL